VIAMVPRFESGASPIRKQNYHRLASCVYPSNAQKGFVLLNVVVNWFSFLLSWLVLLMRFVQSLLLTSCESPLES